MHPKLLLAAALGLGACGPVASHPSSIIGVDDLEPAGGVADVAWRARIAAVVRVFPGDPSGACTGFFVAEDLVMTNDHCAQPCARLVFEQGYEDGAPADALRSHQCAALVTEDVSLDYAIYRVTPDGPTPAPLVFTRGPTPAGTPLLIASHPGGGFKKVDRSAGCAAIVGPNPSVRTVYHGCDTLSGSSGSPLFTRATGTVAGLHNRGGNGYNAGIASAALLDDLAADAPEVFARLRVAAEP